MEILEKWIQAKTKDLPEECMTKHLVQAGIFQSDQSAFYSRQNGNSPPYLRLGGKIVYPKEGVINWLRDGNSENQQKKAQNIQ